MLSLSAIFASTILAAIVALGVESVIYVSPREISLALNSRLVPELHFQVSTEYERIRGLGLLSHRSSIRVWLDGSDPPSEGSLVTSQLGQSVVGQMALPADPSDDTAESVQALVADLLDAEEGAVVRVHADAVVESIAALRSGQRRASVLDHAWFQSNLPHLWENGFYQAWVPVRPWWVNAIKMGCIVLALALILWLFELRLRRGH